MKLPPAITRFFPRPLDLAWPSLFILMALGESAMAADKWRTEVKLDYTCEQQGERRKLAEHCIAIEKDGLAVDPYVFLHGVNGKKTAGFFKTRTSLSLQGDDPMLKSPGTSEPPLYAKNELILPTGVPITDLNNRFPLRDGVVRKILEGSTKTRKGLLIFAHGGNSSLDGAIERAERLIPLLREDGYYPLFICWNSNLVSTWGEHLVRVRNGVDYRQQRPGYGWATSPLYLATDLATAVVRAPRTLLENTLSTGEGDDPLAYKLYPTVRAASERYLIARARGIEFAREYNYQTDPDGSGRAVAREPMQAHEERIGKLVDEKEGNRKARANRWNDWLDNLPAHAKNQRAPMVVSMGEFRATTSAQVERTVGYLALSPFKVAVAGAFAGGGESMWAMMNRRIDHMFYHDRSFEAGSGYSETEADLAAGDTTGIGALSVFFRQLEQYQREEGSKLKLTLVGHSMGAIIFNQALALFPKMKCPTIVYMAPACSIADFNLMVTPYLRENPGTQFYNLCLHPRAEKRERSLGDNWKGELVPRGSLLMWIDDFLEHPRSFSNRTFGQFENAMLASRMFHPRVQQQIHLCAMSSLPNDDGPVKHGDFSQHRFWIEEFYRLPGWESRSIYNLKNNVESTAGKKAPEAKPVKSVAGRR